MSKSPRVFSKPAITITDQVTLLKKRGLEISDLPASQQALRYIGYYRLSAYMRPFQASGADHQFNEGTAFSDIDDLYSFDRKLRIVFLDALDRIEIGIKAAATQALCQHHGPAWFLDPKNFLPTADHGSMIEKLKDEIGTTDFSKRAVHIQHYYNNYDEPELPPSWMLMEAISFGSLARLIKNLNAKNMKSVAWLINIPEPALKSWCLSLSYVRNLCAHHNRIWNRIYTLKPFITKQHKSELDPNDKIYAQAVTIYILLRNCSTGAPQWKNRIANLFNEHPRVPIDKMGFPTDWLSRPFWR